MTGAETVRLIGAVKTEHERTAAQIESLERAVTSIIEASELTATDDEHDPEGATIAYERAQAAALLRHARLDLERLDDALERLETGEPIVCGCCGSEILIERLLAVPTTRTCIRCAS